MHDDYLEELDGELARLGVSARQRRSFIEEIAQIQAEGVDLGEAKELAEKLAAPSCHGLAETTFEPAHSSWLAKRRLGKGADLNWGQVAVKLGLIFPDEADDDVLAAIPPKVMTAVRWLPTAISAATAVKGVAVLRRGARIPWNISLGGRIKKTAPAWSALVAMACSAILAAGTAGAADRKTLLLRSADATSMNLAALFQISLSSFERNGRVHPAAYGGFLCLALAAQGVILIVPTRAGRARVAVA